MKTEFTLTPRNSEINFLTDRIDRETPDFGTTSPFAIFIRNSEGGIIAGCNGSVLLGAIYTDQLWVHPDHRRSG